MLADVLDDPTTRHPSIARWLAAVGSRPAVQRGMAVPQV